MENKGNFADFKLKRKGALKRVYLKEFEEGEAKFSYSIGTTVTLQRLKKSNYNGLQGTVVSFDGDKGRYKVRTKGGRELSVLRRNLLSEITVESLPTSDLIAILIFRNKQGYSNSHFREKSELEAIVLEIAPSSKTLSDLRAKALAHKKHARQDEPVPMDIDEPETKKRRIEEHKNIYKNKR